MRNRSPRRYLYKILNFLVDKYINEDILYRNTYLLEELHVLDEMEIDDLCKSCTHNVKEGMYE